MYLRYLDGHRVVGGTIAWWGQRVGGGEQGETAEVLCAPAKQGRQRCLPL